MGPRTPDDERSAEERLARIEARFHALVRERASNIQPPPDLQLPRLQAAFPKEGEPAWFPVPGMYGGFAYWFVGEGLTLRLITESWCRVVDGSGQRHEITEDACRLVGEGFV